MVATLLLAHGTRAQQDRYLPGMSTGAARATMALTEPGGGSDLQALRTTARVDGDEYVINGRGHRAPARRAKQARHNGIMKCPHGWVSPEVEMTCLDDAEIVVRCEREPSVSMRFAERHVAVGRLFFLVQIRIRWLDARVEGVTNLVVGDPEVVVAEFEGAGGVVATGRPYRIRYVAFGAKA